MPAPHLPPQACSIAAHTRMRSLPWLIFFIFVAALTGVTASLGTLVWLAPSVDSQGTLYSFVNRQATSSLDPSVVIQLRQRMVTLYKKSLKVDGAFYSVDAAIGTGATLTTDGWIVMSRPGYRAGEEAQWEAVDSRGVVYPVQGAVHDAVTGLLYIHLNATGLRIIPLIGGDDSLDTLFAAEDANWKHVTLDTPIRESSASLPLWRPGMTRPLLSSTLPNALVANAEGTLAGFVSAEGRLIPAWLIGQQIPTLLEREQVMYRGVSFEGYRVVGVIQGESQTMVQGWYIAKASTKATSSTVGRGDVLLRVNDHGVENRDELSRLILTGPEILTMTVLRAGKEVELRIEKEQVFASVEPKGGGSVR